MEQEKKIKKLIEECNSGERDFKEDIYGRLYDLHNRSSDLELKNSGKSLRKLSYYTFLTMKTVFAGVITLLMFLMSAEHFIALRSDYNSYYLYGGLFFFVLASYFLGIFLINSRAYKE